MSLTSILHLLPPYIHDIEDYLSLTSTSRAIRTIHEHTSPHTLLLLCYTSRRVFFRPDPLFLLTHLARPLSTWAHCSPQNLKRLVESFWSGPEAVLDLAVGVKEVAILAKWSLGKVREIWEWRMRVVQPVTDLIDKCVGAQWYNQPDFWDVVEDEATLYADPDETFFRMVIYGEMFTEGSVYTRMEYIKYMVPDWHIPPRPSDGSPGLNPSTDITSTRTMRPGEFSYYTEPVKLERDGFVRTIHPLKAVQKDIGPYSKGEIRDEFASVVLHLLRASPLWRKYKGRVDLEGMERVAAMLRGEAAEVSEVEAEGKVQIGSAWTTETPNLFQDLCVALCDK